jgi:hypothetical protein
MLEKYKPLDVGLGRFRGEAEEFLQLKEKEPRPGDGLSGR